MHVPAVIYYYYLSLCTYPNDTQSILVFFSYIESYSLIIKIKIFGSIRRKKKKKKYGIPEMKLIVI